MDVEGEEQDNGKGFVKISDSGLTRLQVGRDGTGVTRAARKAEKSLGRKAKGLNLTIRDPFFLAETHGPCFTLPTVTNAVLSWQRRK